MKRVIVLSWFICTTLFVFGQEAPKIEVYYFHLKNRCATCKAVEDVTTETLKNNFASQMEAGEIVFKSINMEDKNSKALVKKMKVRGQSLLLVKGDSKTDITAKGFQYARTKPKDFAGIIEKEIKLLLK